MKEMLLTSSALILALLVLRLLFRNRISRRVQYALWLLVLARLLIPASLPEAELSLLAAAEPVVQQLEVERALYLSPVRETVIGPEGGEILNSTPAPNAPLAVGQSSPDNTRVFTDGSDVIHEVEYARQVDLVDLLRWVWYGGMAVMAVWLLAVNLRFSRKLRKARTPYSVEGCKYPVYLVETGLASPCLFGLLRPAIYLTPAAAAPERLRHVIAHESAHARHLDPLWALLRGVCLSVYWFDPLVWLAAAVSKTDGELACDEAALAALGPGERVSYGQTLLALIPVRRGPGAPLLSATTMTAGKRQLRDRVARIAEDRQTRSAAVLAVLALAAGICAVTFTGADSSAGFRSLTSQELDWFNQEWFNQDEALCLPNQFLTSLYDAPEEIDLYQLFYNGTGETEGVDEAERQMAAEAAGGDPGTDLIKVSADGADAVLEQYAGLTLSRTREVGLDQFAYLESTDAYYDFHGDTNALTVTFSAGERRGDTVRLYYDAYGSFLGDQLVDSWACVTLEEQADGSYHFVSHRLCDMPAIPTAYPAWDPALTLPVSDLTAYEPQAAAVSVRTGDLDEGLDFYLWDQVTVEIYRATDGSVLASYAPVSSLLDAVYDGEKRCFFTFPGEEGITLGGFRDVLGYDGVVISYPDQLPGSSETVTVSDYYIFDDGLFSGGGPALLARVYGTASYIDLDGDGQMELCASSGSTAQVFFRRGGRLYQADLTALLGEAWPEAEHLAFDSWDAAGRFLPLWADVPIPGADSRSGTAFRWLFFDGDRFLVYRDERTYTDHVAEDVDIPAEVLERCKIYVQGLYETPEEGFLLVDGEFEPAPVVYDDWRILSVDGPYYEETAGLLVEIWRLNCQLHTTTPDAVVLAGSRYMTEDGWVSAGYPDSDYFYFQVEEHGGLTYLFHESRPVGTPGTELFRSDLINTLSDLGILSLAYLPGQTLLEMLEVQRAAFLERLGQHAVWEQAQAIAALAQAAASAREQFETCASEMEAETLSAQAQRAWAALCTAVDSWMASGGSILTNSRLGLSLQAPAGWEELAEVYSGGSSDTPVQVFSLYERTAHGQSPGMGLLWNLSAFTRESFEHNWPGADGSGVLGASSYLIGSDEAYLYLLSTPTDVQFLEEDLNSCVAYATLKAQSQQVLEDFLVRNDIAPNPLCPDADGCYRYTGALIVTPEKPVEEADPAAPAEELTDGAIRAALLADYARVNPAQETEDSLVYQTEAHRVLAREESSETCTVYLTAWRATFTLTDGRYDMSGGDRIPTALTFTWDGGAWRLTEYWTPGDGASYGRDLREKFPPEAAAQELDADTVAAIADELMEQCRQDAVKHFTALTGSVPAAAFQPSDVEFSGQALETYADEMTYDERLEWAADTGIPQGTAFVSTGRYLEGQNCLAALGQWVGTPHVDQYSLCLRFSDGTMADLPLPRSNEVNIAKPDTMEFTGGTFVYTVTFSDPAVTNEGQTLLHLAGTYCYEVDLAARTVSLTVLES